MPKVHFHACAKEKPKSISGLKAIATNAARVVSRAFAKERVTRKSWLGTKGSV